MAASPASSPRLPSPPPMAEDQISPNPQGMADEHGKLGNGERASNPADSRRVRPGTKSEDIPEGPPLVDFHEIDSAFQLTEHIKALHNSYTHPTTATSTSTASNRQSPVDKATAQLLARPPPTVDPNLWLYELCRFLTQKANSMVVGLFTDSPPCSSVTCPEMRASEWQYLCAAHEPPKSCCAIDYCCHTLDWCATTLTSTKLFPSRLALGGDNAPGGQVQIRKMTEVFRRVYRIFAHAWFSHRDVFWRVENKTGLYVLFKTVCDEYNLIPPDNYTIPPEAEGIDTTPVAAAASNIPRILTRDKEPAGAAEADHSKTTRKHRHTPSTISERSVGSVATVIHEEVDEDDDGDDDRDALEYADERRTGVPVLTDEHHRAGSAAGDQEEGGEQDERGGGSGSGKDGADEDDIPTEDAPPYEHPPEYTEPAGAQEQEQEQEREQEPEENTVAAEEEKTRSAAPDSAPEGHAPEAAHGAGTATVSEPESEPEPEPETQASVSEELVDEAPTPTAEVPLEALQQHEEDTASSEVGIAEPEGDGEGEGSESEGAKAPAGDEKAAEDEAAKTVGD